MCVTLPPTILLSYPCLCMRISILDRVHQLIYISSHSPPSLRKYKWHPGILPGKCYSGIPCACGFICGSWNTATPNWRLRASSLVTLVGTNKHLWHRCRGRQNRNWYSLAKQANLALFSCLCWYENRVVYDRFWLAAKLSFRSRVTFEEDTSSSRVTSKITLGSWSSHCIVVSS